MEEETNNSYFYEKLSQELKEKADAIIGYLSGMNTKDAKKLLTAIDEELVYRSTVL